MFTTVYVHVYLGNMFEDCYVQVKSNSKDMRGEAIKGAKKQLKGTALDHMYANYVL